MRNFAFQDRVWSWVTHCFTPRVSDSATERALRFLEEAIELGQAQGLTQQ